MGHMNRILGIAALAFGLIVLTEVLSTDAYLKGAQAQASADETITYLISNGSNAMQVKDARLKVSEGNTNGVAVQ